MAHPVLKCISYNCRGLNVTKKTYIAKLLEQCDILFLQEIWVSDAQLDELGKLSSTHLFTGVSGFGNSDVLSGRPYGGCAILWRSNLNLTAMPLSADSRRVCALLLSSSEFKFLCINAYMPYEDDNVNFDEFRRQLSVIDDIIERNVDSHIILGGDFNVDFSRNWSHTVLLNDFCLQSNLTPVIKHRCNHIDYTYNFSMKSFSAIDHFILSSQLFDKSLLSALVLHDVDNTSDHDPLVVELDCSVARLLLTNPSHVSKPAWSKATPAHIANYKVSLCEYLHGIVLPVEALLCRNVCCQDKTHITDIDVLANSITQACLMASQSCIPCTGRVGSRGHIPGWTELVAPVRDKSIMWHNIWIECGRPRSGVVADIMRKTRAAYHYAIRKARRNEDNIINERFADALINNSSRDFWSEARKIRRSKSCSSSVIDGISTADGIADLFSYNYQDLYNSVAYDSNQMEQIKCSIDDSVRMVGCTAHSVVGASEVTLAVNKLKAGKNDGGTGLCSDHFKHGCAELAIYLSMLFTALLIHGSSPAEMITSTVIPIPKGKGINLTDSANYRGISLSSIYGKVFDLVVLHRYTDKLMTSSLQFGFKAKRSASMCTMVLKEVIAYYAAHGGSLYCTMLDATKAFDRVDYCKLFSELLTRELPPEYTRLLLNMYTSHLTHISWNGIHSAPFMVKNGVKQGGVLSPILFCIYIDSLLLALRNSECGCYIGNVFLGALAYADDIVLLAPTPCAMRALLKLCDNFAHEHSVVFNAKKSKCLYIASRVRGSRNSHSSGLPSFFIGGECIEFVDEWSHLGHVISTTCDDKTEIIKKRNILCGQINNVLCFFGKRDPISKLSLLKSYCTSFYGSVLWDMSHAAIDDLCIVWRKGLRRVWGLPYNAHSILLPPLCGLMPLIDELACRCSEFISNCLFSDCDVINFVARHGVFFARMRSPIGRNALHCTSQFGVKLDDIHCINKRFVWCYVRSFLSADILSTTFSLLELLFIKFDYLALSLLSHNDINDAIHILSTS